MSTFAAVDVHQFETDSQRQRYLELVDELRCPKCQNQNLAGSNSQIAIDLRRELHRLLQEGKTDREIKAFMVARYGDFVLYQPPLRSSTLVLWAFPLILLVLGLLIVVMILSHRKKMLSHPQSGLSEREQETLEQLIGSQVKPEAISQAKSQSQDNQ